MPQPATTAPSSLTPFEPGIRDWFLDTYPAPTTIQALAWPAIAAGENVLLTAPTGSGKTLTAFLWALNQFAAGVWTPGHTRVLYLSPLKALNNDIQRNLLEPLAELERRGAVPPLQVQTRSGDTPAGERQRMLRRPPEILITTPESLMLLLTGSRGRHALATVETVIVDEVHAIADNRRGTLAFTALERLVEMAGEVQRIALSATVRPLDAMARFVAGFDAHGTPRPMRVVDGGGDKRLSLRVVFPDAARHAADAGRKIWEPLGEAFRSIITGNRATLFFVNSRRLAERLTAAINKDQDQPLAYAHHGSLSREIRLEVESRLKHGELKAIVATSSLEMGIDIGALDEVVLIQAPPSVAATLQRIGRAGHRVGEESRGALFPTFGQDFVQAAALAQAVAERDLEPLLPLENPLDVLCQIIVSMTASEPWPVDALFAVLRRSGPYRALPRAQFDLVLEMLAGRYAGSRVRELEARLNYDRIRQTVQARRAAVLAFYNAGGVIPDRGYYQIRHLESGTSIGELDEEFVWEATVGQIFSLGTSNWQIHRITHNDVLVKPTASASNAPPFWRAETRSRSFHYSRHIGDFLERAENHLARGGAAALAGDLVDGHGFDAVAAEELIDLLQRQRAASGAPLPHRHHLLAERVLSGPGGYRGAEPIEQLVLHTFWGGRVNRPWSLALRAALEAAGVEADVHVDDDALALQSREPLDARQVIGLVTPANLERLLRRSLEGSGFFGARFREAAGRALLLGRRRFNTRLPLWMSRMQAKKLLSSVREFDDFPVLLEVWRTCLNDDFDLPALRDCLDALADGSIALSTCTTGSPSPFAANLSFDQINPYMYASDRPDPAGASSLSDELIESAVRDAALRPKLDAATVIAFEAKRQRTAEGYAPDGADEWAEWIKERVLVPAGEVPAELEHPDLAVLTGDAGRWIAHRELLQVLFDTGLAAGTRIDVPAAAVDDPRTATQLALEVLSYYGPLRAERIAGTLPTLPDGLLEDDALVHGALLDGDAANYYCDRDNLEALLRLQRALRRPRIDARPTTQLPAYLAAWQGLAGAGPQEQAEEPALALESAVETLRAFAAPVETWLYDLPAARVPGFQDHDLDRTFSELGLAWQGAGNRRVRVGFPEDLQLVDTGESAAADATPPGLFADPGARYGFLQLADRQHEPLAAFNERWWQAVWAGAVSADTLTPLRQGLTRDFALAAERPRSGAGDADSRLRAGRRRRAPRYRRSAFADPWAGTWYLLPRPEVDPEALLALEDAKDRARLLLDRYGFACRELANREGDSLRWSALFRSLRIMELAGEVVTGHFFDGLSGPQFALPAAVSALQSPIAPGTFWCSAVDPVSPCGLGLDWPALPQRRPQHALAFRNGDLALVVENQGKRLTFHVAADEVDEALLAPLRRLLARRGRLLLEDINGKPPRSSPYLATLETLGRVVSDHRASYLERR
ncbi:MAG: DEAD/DEAH box helicase [Pseudomonadales bacterium]